MAYANITTALSRFTTLFVIARNSSFTYKGRAVDIKQVGRELGVHYVLEGNVRKAAGRLRITGQLIEASSGAHLWAEKFDGALKDVFELQDAVTERVVGAIETSVNQAEINRSHAKPTGNLDAYDYYLRALQQYTLYTRAGSDAAIENAQKAISLDPDYALAKALLSSTYMSCRIRGWGTTGDAAKALAVAREAIAQDSNNPSVLRWAGSYSRLLGASSPLHCPSGEGRPPQCEWISNLVEPWLGEGLCLHRYRACDRALRPCNEAQSTRSPNGFDADGNFLCPFDFGVL